MKNKLYPDVCKYYLNTFTNWACLGFVFHKIVIKVISNSIIPNHSFDV